MPCFKIVPYCRNSQKMLMIGYYVKCCLVPIFGNWTVRPVVAIYTLKENLPQGHAMIQMDFAENCACTSAGQVQSTYWNSSVVTLHPVVTYFKDESNTLQHKNFAYVSDELGHNFGTVYSFVKDIVKEIKGTVENLAG
jgi:hypothetical protein